MVVKTPLTWLPKAIRTEMATTEMKARIKAYSTRVWPFLLFIRRSAFLARIITLLIIVFHLPSIRNSLNLEILIVLYRSVFGGDQLQFKIISYAKRKMGQGLFI